MIEFRSSETRVYDQEGIDIGIIYYDEDQEKHCYIGCDYSLNNSELKEIANKLEEMDASLDSKYKVEA